jgi:hypothetical protein
MVCVFSNDDRHPATKTVTPLHYTPLHYTCRHFTSSHLNFTQLHSTSLHFTQLRFTTVSLGLTPFKFPAAPFHLPSLRFTPLHFTSLLDDFRHTSITFASPTSHDPTSGPRPEPVQSSQRILLYC